MDLPKGITTTSYTTKRGKKVKFQVRYQKDDFKTCKTFETIEKATEYLLMCKSKYEILLQSDKDDLIKSIMQNVLEPNLSKWIDDYVDYRFGHLKNSTDELKKKYYTSVRAQYNSICNTKIDYSYFNTKDRMAIANNFYFKHQSKHTLGTMRLDDISPNVINAYIRTKLNDGLKKISVLSYVSMLSRFFEDLQHLNESLIGFANPCKSYDKKLLSKAMERTAKTISETDQAKIEAELLKSINKDVIWIYRLALETACRRAELIFLTWENVYIKNEEYPYISIIDSKTGSRTVFLSKTAIGYLEELYAKHPTKHGRIFTTSINAFERVFKLSVKRLGLFGKVHFHMTRKTAISNVMFKSKNNALIVSEILGFTNADRIKTNHRVRLHSEKTEQDYQEEIGHANINTTLKSYATLK